MFQLTFKELENLRSQFVTSKENHGGADSGKSEKNRFLCYDITMTEAAMIAHWRKGARDALEAAVLLKNGGKYQLSLFSAHLATEKALKTVYMSEERKEPLPTHNLVLLARQLKRSWSDDDIRKLDYLTQYSIAARYDDPLWAEREATEENCEKWIDVTTIFLSSLLP